MHFALHDGVDAPRTPGMLALPSFETARRGRGCHQSMIQKVIHDDLAEVPMNIVVSAFNRANQVYVAGMGEPLLSGAAFDLTSRARASGSYVKLITNSTTLERSSRPPPAVDFLRVIMDGGTTASFPHGPHGLAGRYLNCRSHRAMACSSTRVRRGHMRTPRCRRSDLACNFVLGRVDNRTFPGVPDRRSRRHCRHSR